MRCASRIFSAAAIVATLGLALAATKSVSWAQVAWAQASHTIRVVVSVPAGGAIDALVRILADEIGRTSGQTIVIDSWPGAGGAIAAVNSFGRAVEALEVKAKLALQALYPDAHCGSDFAAYTRRQYDEYARVMRELNIKGE